MVVLLSLLFLAVLPWCPAVQAEGQVCKVSQLQQCGPHEACQEVEPDVGICTCMDGFKALDSHCVDIHYSSGYAVWWVTVLVLLVVVVACCGVVYAQRKFNIMVPLGALLPSSCPDICPQHLFGVRRGRSRMMETLNTDDDDPALE